MKTNYIQVILALTSLGFSMGTMAESINQRKPSQENTGAAYQSSKTRCDALTQDNCETNARKRVAKAGLDARQTLVGKVSDAVSTADYGEEYFNAHTDAIEQSCITH